MDLEIILAKHGRDIKLLYFCVFGLWVFGIIAVAVL